MNNTEEHGRMTTPVNLQWVDVIGKCTQTVYTVAHARVVFRIVWLLQECTCLLYIVCVRRALQIYIANIENIAIQNTRTVSPYTVHYGNVLVGCFPHHDIPQTWTVPASEWVTLSLHSFHNLPPFGSCCQLSPLLNFLADGLACDWVTNKLYWTDATINSISVYDLDSGYRKQLFRLSTNSTPRAIVVDPSTRWVIKLGWLIKLSTNHKYGI